MGWNMAVVPLWKSNNDISVSIELIIYNFAVFGLEHEFEWGWAILSNIMNEECLLVEDATDGGLFFIPLLCLHGHPFQISRFCFDCKGISRIVWIVIGDGDKFILAACY